MFVFNQSMIEEFGFINAKYLKDWFYLFDNGLKDIFGEEPSKLLKGELVHMIKAPSRDYFDKALDNARTKLRNIYVCMFWFLVKLVFPT